MLFLLEQTTLNRCQQQHRTNALLTHLARPNATPVTLTEGSLRTSQAENIWCSCLPKIEECGPRPSPLSTSDWTRGPLWSSPLSHSKNSDIKTSEGVLSTAIWLLCTVYLKFLLCLLFPFRRLLCKPSFCRLSFRLLPR